MYVCMYVCMHVMYVCVCARARVCIAREMEGHTDCHVISWQHALHLCQICQFFIINFQYFFHPKGGHNSCYAFSNYNVYLSTVQLFTYQSTFSISDSSTIHQLWYGLPISRLRRHKKNERVII
jgi:hypothetical protein